VRQVPDLPPVNEDFTADNSDYIAKVQEMINATQELSDKLTEAAASAEELHAALDDLPDQKEIRIAITGIANEQIAELEAALDQLPADKEITVTLVDEALAGIETLQFALDELHDKEIEVTVIYNEIGKPTALELPEAPVVQAIDQSAEQALKAGAQAVEEGAEGTAYTAEVVGARDLADAMGQIANAAPLAVDGVERLAVGTGEVGEAAENAGVAIEGAGQEIKELGSPERIQALEHARDVLNQISTAQREAEGLPAENAKVIQGKGIPIEDFFTEDTEDAEAAAREAEQVDSRVLNDANPYNYANAKADPLAEIAKFSEDLGKGGDAGDFEREGENDGNSFMDGFRKILGGGGKGGGGGGGGGGGSAYEGMFEGVIVAAAATAPFIAQALSGAITAGLGFALAGIGAYAAMKLEPVKQAFSGFKNTVSQDLQQIGIVFAPVMESIFRVASNVFTAMTPIFKTAEEIIAGPFKAWADTFLETFQNPAVEAAIEAVAKAFASILRVVTPELASMAEKFAGALIALVNNIGSHPEATRDFLNFLATLPGAILSALNALTDIAEYVETHPLFKNLLDIGAFEDMINAVQALFHGQFLTALKDLGDMVVSTFKSMGAAIIDIWDMLPAGFRNAVNNIVDDVRKGFEDIPGIAKTIWDTVASTMESVWNSISSVAPGVWKNISNAVVSSWQTVDGIAKTVWNAMAQTIISAWNTVSSTAKTVWDDIENVVEDAWGTAVRAVESLGNSFSQWWSTHGQALEEIWNVVWDSIKGVVEEAWSLITGTIKTAWTIVEGLFDTGTSTVKGTMSAGTNAITTIWDTFWSALESTTREAWAIIGPLVTAGWVLVKSAFDVGVAAIDLVWNNLWSVIEAVARTAWDAVAALVKVGWDLVVGAFNVGVAAVEAVWHVLWAAIELVVRTAWDAVAALLKIGWDVIVGIFSVAIDLLTGHWKTAWTDIKNTAEQVWNAISAFFTQALHNYSSFFESVLNAIKPFWAAWWNDVKSVGEQVWNAMSAFFTQAFNAYRSMFEEVWNNIKSFFLTTWNAIENDAKSVWGGIMGFFNGVWSSIEKGFTSVVSNIKSVWGTLQSIFDGPVNFLVHTVYDNGIAKLWNDVMGAIGGPKLPTLASGGKLPGYGGGDILPALLEPGETVVSKEHSKMLADTFRAVGVPGYASGGATPGSPAATQGATAAQNAKEKALEASEGTEGALPGGGVLSDIEKGIKGVAGIVAALITGNSTALTNDLMSVIGAGGAKGELADMITGVPKTMIKDMIKWLMASPQLAAKKAQVAEESTAISGSAMQNLLSLAKYLVAHGLTAAAAAGVAGDVYGESGGNPESVNCVPLTYKVVTDRGILQHWEVRIGDLTPTYNPRTGRMEDAVILDVPYHYNARICRLGNLRWSVICTWDHKWITEDGLVRTDEMQKGTKVLLGDGWWEPVDFIWDMEYEDTFCLTTTTGTWCAYRDEEVAADEGNQSGKFWTGNSGGFGLIGWTGNTIGLPAGFTGPTGNATHDLDEEIAGVLGYIQANGGVAALNAASTNPTSASDYFSQVYERPLVLDSDTRPSIAAEVYAELAAASAAAAAEKSAGTAVKALSTVTLAGGGLIPATHDAGGWLYPGMNLINNNTGGIERTVGPREEGEGHVVHSVVNLDGKTIFESMKPYVYQYNARNSGNGNINGIWRPR
jgi:phage-related protein